MLLEARRRYLVYRRIERRGLKPHDVGSENPGFVNTTFCQLHCDSPAAISGVNPQTFKPGFVTANHDDMLDTNRDACYRRDEKSAAGFPDVRNVVSPFPGMRGKLENDLTVGRPGGMDVRR